MSVVSVTETAESRSGEDSFEKVSGVVKIAKGFTRSFIVETNDPQDGWEIVRKSLPALNSFYSSGNDTDLKAVCTNRSGQQQAMSRLLWECECEYETEKSDAEDGGADVEELERELRQTVRWSVEFRELTALRDVDGTPILNAAKDAFDPPAMTVKPVLVANVSRVERPEQFSAFALDRFADSVNDDGFSIDGQQFKAGEAIFAGYDSQDIVRNGERAKQVTYVIKIQIIYPTDNPDNHPDFSHWDLELLQQGPNYLDSNGAKRPVVDTDSGFRYNANLNKETGAKLAIDADPHYSFFKIHARQSFSTLGLS